METAAHQVYIARKFYNDLAGRTIDDRRRPLSRVLRLAGSAPPPEFFDMDDALVDGDRPRAMALIDPAWPRRQRGERPWYGIRCK